MGCLVLSLVVDVYSEWCGPCIGMVGNLKKIKVEIGGDNLHLAVAKSDTIECLKRFRNRSEPTWMFLAAGQLVNVIFGADAPRIARTIEQELQNEELAKKGERERPQRAPHELTPPEQEVASAQEKLAQERRAREEAAVEAARLARREARAKRLETHFVDVCAALVAPHAQKHLRKISDPLEPLGVVLADKCPIMLDKNSIRVLAIEEPALGTDAAIAAVADRPSLALLLKKQPDKEGDVIEITRRILFGDGIELEEGETPKKTVAEELVLDSVPGLVVPADRHQRAAIMDLLFPKMVSTLVEPPTPAEPPHVAIVFGAWQRRAVLNVASNPKVSPRVLRYGFFADANVNEPRLLCKTIDQYELRPEKDYCETMIVMAAVGLAEPALADPSEPILNGPPAELIALGALAVSEDAVSGREQCARLFPPGYSEPEHRPKPKAKKKKKKIYKIAEITRRILFGDGIELEEGETPKKTVAEELVLDSVPGLVVPADRHQRAAIMDLLFPKMVSTLVEPPTPAEPPHVAIVFGAWQRRAVLNVASNPKVSPRVLRYGFFADANVNEPRLLCKTIDQYELRPEKDYCETMIVMAAVGLAEPALADPSEPILNGPPAELIALGALAVSEDAVSGREQCARLFPPGYSEPEHRPKPKAKKKKKKRHEKESPEGSTEIAPAESTETDANEAPGDGEDAGEGEGEGEGDAEGEGEADEEDGDEAQGVDKATSPPPLTPH